MSLVKPPKKDTPLSALASMGLISQLGLVVALPIVGGVIGGVYLDRWLGWKGVFTLAGLFLGLAGGAYAAYDLLKREL